MKKIGPAVLAATALAVSVTGTAQAEYNPLERHHDHRRRLG
ncbi:hypothetical protein [Lentzea aerocolonigenes]|nr:hypothetical protein [Lentzea aerocolonigenes]